MKWRKGRESDFGGVGGKLRRLDPELAKAGGVVPDLADRTRTQCHDPIGGMWRMAMGRGRGGWRLAQGKSPRGNTSNLDGGDGAHVQGCWICRKLGAVS